jgi:hypothetical protein
MRVLIEVVTREACAYSGWVWRKAIGLDELMSPGRHNFGSCSPLSLPYSQDRRQRIGFFVELMKAGLYSVV